MAKTRSTGFSTTINIVSGLAVLVTNVGISFFLSPYIIRTIGVEANGFVNLANNFVTYAGLIVTALNAMAARFITIAYIKKDYQTANLYYNSVFWGNLVIVAAFLIPATILVLRLENFVDVPMDILTDVKILFAIVLLLFFINTGAPNWDCGTYIANRMDRSNFPSAIIAVLKCVILFVMFSILTPHVWYVGFSSTLAGIIYLLVQGYNTHTLTPELKILLKKPICSLHTVKNLVGSGIWNAIANGGNTLMSGLDLLVCNKFLGATLMGVLSVSKSLPNILTTFSETIRGAFGPELTITYASGNKEEVFNSMRKSIKISTVIVTIPTAGIIVMSGDLYRLWVPTQNAELLQMLTILAVLRYVFCSGITNLNTVFVTVNKVKCNSIALVITGAVSLGVTFGAIAFTDWDIYAVAGVSSIVMIIKDVCFMAPVATYFLGYKWYKFYPSLGISCLCCSVIVLAGITVRWIIPVDSWFKFFFDAGVIGTIGLFVNMRIVLNKSEREYFKDIIKRKILKKQ